MSNPDRNRSQEIERIVAAALELSDPRERGAFLDDACGHDTDLRHKVEEWLESQSETDLFKKEEAIFSEAVLITDTIERKAYLDRAFENCPQVKQQVEELLRVHFVNQGLLDTVALNMDDGPWTAAMATSLSEREGSQIGRYKLLQQIGEGGMGVVYMAEQEEPVRRKVALKIIKLGMDTRQVVARFEAERQALAMMDHPNIARVLDGGATNTGRPYFVMELVQGVPINEFCDKNLLTTEDRIRLLIPVCHAIQSAHQKGIIHRDIKPSNVLVTLLHGEPMAKVIDFGIAKATHQRLTEKTLFTNYAQMIGTPAYMSPEQAELSALDVDTRTDVYSLGVLLYELLTGTPPFPEERLRSLGYGEMRRVIAEEEPETPSVRLSTFHDEKKTAVARKRGMAYDNLRTQLKGDLDWISMKCLEKDRRRRYETPGELAADLNRFLENEPVLAAAATFAYRLQKYYRRHKRLVLSTATVMASLIIASLVSGYFAYRNYELRLDAENARVAEADQRAKAVDLAEKAVAATQLAQEAQKETMRLLEVSRHEEGKTWLERADHFGQQNNFSAARLLAARAIGFEGMGRSDMNANFRANHPVLLRTDSKEYRDAQRILASEPAYSLIWTSPFAEPYTGYRFLDFSRDGGYLAAARSGGEPIKLFDGSNKSLMQSWSIPGSGTVEAVAIDPTGSYIACSDFNGGVYLMIHPSQQVTTLATAEPVETRHHEFQRGYNESIQSLHFNPEGDLLTSCIPIASNHSEFIVRQWRMPSQQQVFNSTLKYPVEPWTCGLSPQGDSIAVPDSDGNLQLFELPTGALLKTLSGHRAEIQSTVFTDDGRWVATFDQAGTILVRDIESNRILLQIDGEGSWRKLIFSPDKQYLAVTGPDLPVRIWRIQDGNRLPDPESSCQVKEVAFRPGSNEMIGISMENTMESWDIETGHALSGYQGHRGRIDKVSFSPTGRWLATSSNDGSLILWSTITGRMVHQLFLHSPLTSIQFSSDETFLVVLDASKMLTAFGVSRSSTNSRIKDYTPYIRRWELDIAQPLEPQKVNGEQSSMPGFSIDGAARRIAVIQEGELTIRDLQSGELVQSIPTQKRLTRCVRFDPSDTLLAVATTDRSILIIDLESMNTRELKGHASAIGKLLFDPETGRLFSSDKDLNHLSWSRDFDSYKSFLSENRCYNLVFRSDSKVLAGLNTDYRNLSSNDDIPYTIQLFQKEGFRKSAVLKDFGSASPIRDIDLSPDGSLLASGKSDGSVSLWDIGEPDKWTMHLQSVVVAVNLEEHTVVTINSDMKDRNAEPKSEGLLRVWDTTNGALKSCFWGYGNGWNRGFFLSPDATLFAISKQDEQVVDLLDLKTGELKHRFSSAPYELSWGVKFSPGNRFMSVTTSHDFQIFEIETGERIKTLAKGDYWGLNFTPDGRYLILQGNRLWSIIPFSGPNPSPVIWRFNGCHFSDDGSILAYSIQNMEQEEPGPAEIHFRSYSNGKLGDELPFKIKPDFFDRFLLEDFSPNGKWLAAINGNGYLSPIQPRAFIWNIETGQLKAKYELSNYKLDQYDTEEIKTVLVKNDGSVEMAVTANMGRSFRTWKPDENAPLPNPNYAALFDEFLMVDGKTFRIKKTKSAGEFFNWIDEKTQGPFSNDTLKHLFQSPAGDEEKWRALFWKFYRKANWRSALLALRHLETWNSGETERETLERTFDFYQKDYDIEGNPRMARTMENLSQALKIRRN